MGRRVLVPKYATKHNPKCRQACRSAKSTPGDPGKLAMMDRVRSSRPTSRGVEVARRGVARGLQLTLRVGLDPRVGILEPISVLPYLRRPTTVEMNKGNASKSN